MEFNRDGLYYTILTPVALLSGLVTSDLVALMGQLMPPWRPMQQRPMPHWMRQWLVQGVAL